MAQEVQFVSFGHTRILAMVLISGGMYLIYVIHALLYTPCQVHVRTTYRDMH
jgi:hypothetical protein